MPDQDSAPRGLTVEQRHAALDRAIYAVEAFYNVVVSELQDEIERLKADNDRTAELLKEARRVR